MTRRILVDGVGGYLGPWVVKELITKGYAVRVTDLPKVISSLSFPPEVEVSPANLLDVMGVTKLVDGIDGVIHCAAVFKLDADPDLIHKVNVGGTENLCHAALAKGVKHFVHISSADAYGPLEISPASETHPLHPSNPYAVSKARAEGVVSDLCSRGNVPYTFLRPSGMYGPGSKYIAGVFFFFPILFRMLGITRTGYFTGGGDITWTHVEDAAAAAVHVLNNSSAYGEAYNICEDYGGDKGVFVNSLFREFSVKKLVTLPLPCWLLNLLGNAGLHLPPFIHNWSNKWMGKRWAKIKGAKGLMGDFVPHFEKDIFTYFIGQRGFDNSKIKKLGYEIRHPSFAEGFCETVKWYRENKWIPPDLNFKY